MTYQMRKDERRSHTRIELRETTAPVTIESARGAAFPGEIVDISLGGARVRYGAFEPEAGEPVRLRVHDEQAEAEICWRRADEVGLRFIGLTMEAACQILETILRRQVYSPVLQLG
ncbi:MAG: PilZ domain-containing protein [Minwuia sp.]|uniref:PilZ domain-containing protein n=1 Tax=Minwuia sp. TaxID=2493630 RepID=UPI003A87CE3E